MTPMQFDLDAIDEKQIGRLLELLAESDIEECEIEQGECRLTVKRTVQFRTGPLQPERAASPTEGRAPDEAILLRASAVGIFYRSEDHSSPARVEVGTEVRAGDVLGCIEVMTIPHSVFSTHDGVVESFLVEDGQPVEYGQPIVSIRPSAISSL